jgi:hypothetical protein
VPLEDHGDRGCVASPYCLAQLVLVLMLVLMLAATVHGLPLSAPSSQFPAVARQARQRNCQSREHKH